MLDKLKNVFSTKKEPTKAKGKKKTALDIATDAKEPYINVVGMDINPENISDGSFELEWNDYFIAKLVKAGYMEKKEDKDADIVDRWFQGICRNVVAETYEQFNADPDNRKDLGGGYTEVK